MIYQASLIITYHVYSILYTLVLRLLKRFAEFSSRNHSNNAYRTNISADIANMYSAIFLFLHITLGHMN